VVSKHIIKNDRCIGPNS